MTLTVMSGWQNPNDLVTTIFELIEKYASSQESCSQCAGHEFRWRMIGPHSPAELQAYLGMLIASVHEAGSGSVR